VQALPGAPGSSVESKRLASRSLPVLVFDSASAGALLAQAAGRTSGSGGLGRAPAWGTGRGGGDGRLALRGRAEFERALPEKLYGLVPLPRTHLLCYHGVLALHAGLGALIVPRASAGADAEELTGVLDGLFCG
jgi:hypothetical protein